jgi:kynurenine 3-monooxygenase
MNCGFEDVLVLDGFLYGEANGGKLTSDMEKALDAYTEHRHPDVTAMCELALSNYMEMRSNVLSWSFYARKYIEEALYRISPKSVIPLYTMVSFSRIRYSEVMKRWRRQTFWIHIAAGCVAGALAGLGIWVGGRYLLKSSTAVAASSPTVTNTSSWFGTSASRVKSWISSVY